MARPALLSTVKARLLLAFFTLAAAALVLAAVGWRGLSNTEQALQSLQQEVQPDISRSLELAERTANLAALAPYVAEASSPFQLQGEAEALRQKAREVLALARAIPHLEAAAPRLQPLLDRLEQALDELITLTRQDLFLREDLRQHLFALERLGERLAGADTAAARAPLERQLDRLVAALGADGEGLEVLQRRFALERPSPAGLSPPLARTAAELERLGGAADGVFALRARQLGLRERKAYLLSTTRAVSEQLSDEVKRFVGALQERMAQQGRSVAAAVERGKTGIVAMTLLSLLALAGGSAVVLGLTRRLGAVTRLMTRLAQGDTARATPAVERRDEIGALARAFQVFRDNAVHLKEQTRLLETVFDSMTDGLSVFDRDGRLVAWNPQYLAILRLPAEQIHAGMSLEAVQALLAREPHENRALDGRAVDMAELNLRRREQPSSFERHYAGGRVVEFRSRPMPGGGFVTLYSDLSERKAVEAQLRQAQKMEVLGQLTGGVAHDFNNLLAAVIGNLQLLESTEPLAEAGQRYTRRALAAAERGANLVHRLLAFARRQRLAPEPLRVDELIEGMLDLLEYSVGSGVAIELDLQAGDAWVHADPAQLENALLNLAINASAAMPGGGRLRFATRVQAAETAVEICVADSGSGIPEELLGRVFEPFFTTKPHGQGSGLGLSMVYGFVKQSGGDIRIDSRVGEGTTVSITLPRLPQVAAVASEAPAAAAPPRGRGELVLVVEDDPQVLGAAEDMLRALGYRTLTAASAEAALDCLMREPDIALVFSDVDLGSGMDGLALLAEAARRRPTVRGLLTTGRATAPAERDGSPPLLAKPYRLEQLAAAVRAALG